MRIITLVTISGLLAAASLGHAQSGAAQDCSQAQAGFMSEMGLFRTAFFEREDAIDTAESVMADRVLPSAEQMYQVCPEATVTAVEEVVKRSNASLSDPSREQLVQCDKALITYKGLLSRYDNRSLSGGYNTYRNLLDRDIDPSAQSAIDACPQMPDLARETRIEIAERQSRLDDMEDVDNLGASYFDTRDDVFEASEAYDAAYE